jgi:hypothetical protein
MSATDNFSAINMQFSYDDEYGDVNLEDGSDENEDFDDKNEDEALNSFDDDADLYEDAFEDDDNAADDPYDDIEDEDGYTGLTGDDEELANEEEDFGETDEDDDK